MIVSMDKAYTLDGEAFTVLTVTRPGGIPVAGHVPSGRIFGFYLDGSNNFSTQRLVEVSPYADFVIDEPVMVRDEDCLKWLRGHFAGLTTDGLAKIWGGEGTHWSSKGTWSHWNQCRRPTKEELAK